MTDNNYSDYECDSSGCDSEVSDKQDMAVSQTFTKMLTSSMNKHKIWKNTAVLAVVFIFLFLAYNGLVDLQSSMFIDEGMGVITQSIVYASFSLSCLLLPKLVISQLGHKWTIIVSMVSYILWMAANGYATWITMTITSFLVGISAATLWTAQTTYLTQMADSYARLCDKELAPTLALFFGIFNAIFKIAAFCGNTISWLVLRTDDGNSDVTIINLDTSSCGSEDCPSTNTSNAHYNKIPDPILWTLVGIYLFLAIVGLILAVFFLDSLPRSSLHNKQDIYDNLTAVLKQQFSLKQMLLHPMAIFGALQQTFIWADFNKSYVTCTLGIWMVGLLFLPSVTVDGLASLATGKLAYSINRSYVFLTVFVMDAVVLSTLYFWKPHPDNLIIFILITVLMGVSSGILHVQFNTLVAVIYKDDQETAFSSIRLWSSLAAALAFGINSSLCVKYKILINYICSIIWISCYFILEHYYM